MPGSSFVSASTENFQLDQYTPIDYKNVLEARGKTGVRGMAPTRPGWHRRRLQAYTALATYRENCARYLRQAVTEEERVARDEAREYGDAALLLETILAALIGDQQTIAVDGADDLNASEATGEAA